MILWDSLPSFPPVSLAFFCIHPLILPSFPFRKMIAHCIEKLTFHAAEFVSIWEDIQKLDYYFFFYGCCAFTVLLNIFSLCVRYSTCKLIPVDHLLPLLYYSIKYVVIKAFKGFLLSKTSIFCIWEQEATAFSQAPLVGAEHSRGGISSCFSFRVQ